MTELPARKTKPYGKRNITLVGLLARRGITIQSLASMIFSGSAHLTQVLRGQRRGTRTWARLCRVLDVPELQAAMEFANGKLAESRVKLVLERSRDINERPRIVIVPIEPA